MDRCIESACLARRSASLLPRATRRSSKGGAAMTTSDLSRRMAPRSTLPAHAVHGAPRGAPRTQSAQRT
eukprot:8986329-Pyramimonas_sp.AAC.1